MTRRVEITVSEGTWDRLEAARGHEPRASFVKRALESALRVPPLDSLGPSPSPSLVKAAAEESYKRSPSEPSPKPPVPKTRAASSALESRGLQNFAEQAVVDQREAAMDRQRRLNERKAK